MGCPRTPQQCRAADIAAKLRDAAPDGTDWEARCPVCRHPSLRVSKPERSAYRNIWGCACKHCKCDRAAIRAALLALGILPGCLGSYGAHGSTGIDPAKVAAMEQAVDDILCAPGLRPSDMRIILAEARGQKVPLDRRAFVPWAMSIGVGRRQAYEAAERWCRPADSSSLPGGGVVDT